MITFLRASFGCYLVLISAAVLVALEANSESIKTLKGIDTFGSDTISMSDLIKSHGEEIEMLAETLGFDANWMKQREELEHRIRSHYKLAFVRLSFITYFNQERETYLTVDLVHYEDVEARMPFFEEPKKNLADPGGLLELWSEYLEKAFFLQKNGSFEFPQSCPAWHCTHGFEHADLKGYLKKFDEEAKEQKEKLFEVLMREGRPSHRANAVFLLAHIHDPLELRDRLLPFRRDPSDVVRNNVLRVFSEIARNHSHIQLAIEPFIEAVFYPTTVDRNKSLAVLASLSMKDENKKLIQEKLGPTLLKIIRLKQPNNRDFAYQIMKNLSGKSFSADDFSSWEKWMKDMR